MKKRKQIDAQRPLSFQQRAHRHTQTQRKHTRKWLWDQVSDHEGILKLLFSSTARQKRTHLHYSECRKHHPLVGWASRWAEPFPFTETLYKLTLTFFLCAEVVEPDRSSWNLRWKLFSAAFLGTVCLNLTTSRASFWHTTVQKHHISSSSANPGCLCGVCLYYSLLKWAPRIYLQPQGI